MSWQRIIEVARRQGMPVIVTDVAGREPMVLMPLDGYERLLDGVRFSPGEEKPLPPAKNSDSGPSSVSQEPALTVPVAVSRPAPAPQPPLEPPSEPVPPPPAVNPDSLRRRQRDGDRVEMLHRSLDTVSQVVKEGGPTPGQIEADLLSEERFSFQP